MSESEVAKITWAMAKKKTNGALGARQFLEMLNGPLTIVFSCVHGIIYNI